MVNHEQRLVALPLLAEAVQQPLLMERNGTESLPSVIDGIVDRQALPEIERRYVAPRDELEESLAQIWAKVGALVSCLEPYRSNRKSIWREDSHRDRF